jgi:hypothetical protein
MAGGKANLVLVGAAEGTPAAARARLQEPLVEAAHRSSRRDSEPIWVRNPGNSETVVALGKSIHAYFVQSGFSCISELQSDPHPDRECRILGDFTVYSHPKDCREPNYVGIVTIYEEKGGSKSLKMSPEGGYGGLFGVALQSAITHLPQPVNTLRIDPQSD